MTKLLMIAAVGVAILFGVYEETTLFERDPAPGLHQGRSSKETLTAAIKARQSDVQVHAKGVVSRLLADDNDGSRHQRFIVRLASGATVLIAHNIDLANRIADIVSGDQVEVEVFATRASLLQRFYAAFWFLLLSSATHSSITRSRIASGSTPLPNSC